MTYPKVHEHDDSARPSGPPDKCYYCRRKVGEPYRNDCVAATKTVRVRFSVEYDISVPHHWKKENIHFSLCGFDRRNGEPTKDWLGCRGIRDAV